MYGAILGDIIGSPYEFDYRNIKTKEFPLFSEESEFTDDTVMTIAVADAFLSVMTGGLAATSSGSPADHPAGGPAALPAGSPADHTAGQMAGGLAGKMELPGEEFDESIKATLVDKMKSWGRRYPDAGYGARFGEWLMDDFVGPYNSYGNGSAMRVAAAGWLFDSLDATRRAARLSSEVTHNHPEGIKGAEATASAIYLARTGSTKDEIKDYIVKEFGYDLSRTCDEIRPIYRHVESCQETVPEAIIAFLEGVSFEDVIRTAVSLGGDCDTLTCIAGGIAEAFYGVPEELKEACLARLSEEMIEVLERMG